MSLIEIVDHLGEVRKLGRTETPRGMLRARGATNIQDWRENAGLPRLIPRSQWLPMSAVKGAPTNLIENQRSYGSCSAATATGAQNRQRWLRGMPYVPLSWCWLYDQVNGGRDAGSNMGHVGGVVRTKGVPPMSSYNDCTFRAGRDPQGVQWYQEGDAEITFSNFDEVVTGILMGIQVQHAVDANSLGRFDGNGVCTSVGNSGNHSVYSAGLQNVGGQWVLEMVNSWSLDFGPFGNGTCLITERQVNAVAYDDDAVGHIITLSPTGTQAAPTPV